MNSSLRQYRSRLLAVAALGVALCLASRPACAAPNLFHVVLDTFALPAGGGYNLDFQLNGSDGGSALISHLVFGTGSLTGPATTTNAASVDPQGNITLGPTSAVNFNNEFSQGFTPGQALSFDLSVSPATTSGGVGFTPDSFVFGLFGNPNFTTTGPTQFELATLDFSKASLAVSDFSTYSYSSNTGISFTPVITANGVVPEAGSVVGMGTLLLMSGGLLLRSRRSRVTE